MGDTEVKASKFLSLLLRHNPGEIGLVLSKDGWAKISDLVELTKGRKLWLTRELIERVVDQNDKKRFVMSDDGARIRANQGHSIPVDVGLKEHSPPDVLFHGTASQFIDSIMKSGLLKGARQHVHLSAEVEIARQVGKRHGNPYVLKVSAIEMHRAGFTFYLSENKVWLTDHVPVRFLAPV
jgi:putative RNA 2'-phosphotransferase